MPETYCPKEFEFEYERRQHANRVARRRRGRKVWLIVIALFAVTVGVTREWDRNNRELAGLVIMRGGIVHRGVGPNNRSSLRKYIPFTAWMHPVTSIDLTACQIDDADVQAVCALADRLKLKQLTLSENLRVTDACVEDIDRLKGLEKVCLEGTSVTAESAQRLRIHKGYFPGAGGGSRLVEHDPYRVGKPYPITR